jgi:hypothetical protein
VRLVRPDAPFVSYDAVVRTGPPASQPRVPVTPLEGTGFIDTMAEVLEAAKPLLVAA